AVAVAAGVLRPVIALFGEPPADVGEPEPLLLPRKVRWFAGLAVWAVVLGFVVLPGVALAWKAGGGGTRTGWHVGFFAAELAKVARSDGGILAGSLLVAAGTGAITVGVAWVACRLAAGSRRFGRFLFAFSVLLWVTPAPLVGLGLKDAISVLLDVEIAVFGAGGPVRHLLYDGPSAVPVVWASAIRLFPVAVAVLWPAVRAIPRDLTDAAKLDGLGVVATWRTVVIPLTAGAAVRATAAVAALALAEVGASKLVATPGTRVYILSLFDQMHYGAESTVAALAVLQLAGTAAAAGLIFWAVGNGGRS
ncbi:MAG: hypothetical protein ACRC7O_14200, partial [Fimbriiglobus sp.]